jgi:hypothetical protein
LQNGTVPPTKDVNKERSLFGFVRAIRPHSPTRQSTFDDVLPRSRLSFIKFFHRSGLPNKDSKRRIKAHVYIVQPQNERILPERFYGSSATYRRRFGT